jgi:hypothetical protein
MAQYHVLFLYHHFIFIKMFLTCKFLVKVCVVRVHVFSMCGDSPGANLGPTPSAIPIRVVFDQILNAICPAFPAPNKT